MIFERASVIRTAATALHHAGLLGPLSVASAWLAGNAFQILTYHRVNDDGDPFFPSMPTDVFERHMAWVAGNYETLDLETLVARAAHDRLPRRAIAITFDDGYRDNLTHAAPILARHGLPATIFVATAFIGTGAVPWFDRLAHAFRATKVEHVDAPWGEGLTLPTTADRLVALDRAQRHLKKLPEDEFRTMLDAILDRLGVDDDPGFKNLMLTWDDVQALGGLGFSVGSHTVSHPILSRLSPGRARAEIFDSRAMIESACGRAPRAFAYPNGRPDDYTAPVQQLVREAGFTCAVTTRFGLNTAATPPYELRRGGPWEPDLPTFALKLATHRVSAPR